MGKVRRDEARAKRRNKPSVDQRLLQAMNELMEEGEDFANTSIDRLAKKAGISRATFYLHFADKAELIEFLFDEVEQAIINAAGQWFIDATDATQKSFRDNLFSILTAYRNHYAVIKAMHQTAMGHERIREMNERMVEGFCVAARQAQDQLRAAGRHHDDVTPLVSEILTKSIFYLPTVDPQSLNEEQIGDTCDAWAHIVWASLTRPGA